MSLRRFLEATLAETHNADKANFVLLAVHRFVATPTSSAGWENSAAAVDEALSALLQSLKSSRRELGADLGDGWKGEADFMAALLDIVELILQTYLHGQKTVAGAANPAPCPLEETFFAATIALMKVVPALPKTEDSLLRSAESLVLLAWSQNRSLLVRQLSQAERDVRSFWLALLNKK